MTLRDAIKTLSDAGVPDAAYDARLIFSELSGISPAELIITNPEASAEIAAAIKRRAEREPLAYVLGFADFYKERYHVNESCLIPRQETELLVDFAVKNIPEGGKFLDLCTGSGCIAVSVLKNTAHTSAVCVDISGAALDVARINAEKNGVGDRAEFIRADALATAVSDEVFAVLSNPPYVKDSVYTSLAPEVKKEPKAAFVGGADGADFYRRITALYKDRIKSGGFILYEIGFDQAEILKSIASDCGFSCKIMKDYAGLDRLALLQK